MSLFLLGQRSAARGRRMCMIRNRSKSFARGRSFTTFSAIIAAGVLSCAAACSDDDENPDHEHGGTGGTGGGAGGGSGGTGGSAGTSGDAGGSDASDSGAGDAGDGGPTAGRPNILGI